jgi:hypothetical protein
MIHTGSSAGSPVISVICRFTRTFRALPGTQVAAQASVSSCSNAERANGRAYFFDSENSSTVTFSKSTSPGGTPRARSKGQRRCVSLGVNAPLAPMSSPA